MDSPEKQKAQKPDRCPSIGSGLVLWSFLLAVPVGAQEPGSTSSGVIERAVASIDGRVITLSELVFEARVALIERGGLRGADTPLDDETLRSALQLSIAERLETNEADKLQAFSLEDEEVEAAYRAFRSRFQTDEAFNGFLVRHEADIQQLKSLLARRLRAEKILDSKVRLRARVSEADARRYFEQHRKELGGSFEEVRDQIREKLFRERYRSLTKDEFSQIRQGADVRLIAPFARSPERAAAKP